MNDDFKINVDHLKKGEVENLNQMIPAALLFENEPDLVFSKDVKVTGEAYLADGILVMHLNFEAYCEIPCTICNAPVSVPIIIKGAYQTKPLNEIQAGSFDIREAIRENVLVEVPSFVECHQGQCPERKEIDQYLKKESSENMEDEGDIHRPFSQINFKEI